MASRILDPVPGIPAGLRPPDPGPWPGPLYRDAGFTLIEILVVVGLMALMATLFFPSLTGAFRAGGESQIRRLGSTLGQARDKAMLADRLVRLRVDIDKQTLTLEEAPSSYLVQKEPDRPPSEREREEQAKKEEGTFAPSDLMKEPLKLPASLKLLEVKSPRFKRPLTEGSGFVYFFNNGSTDGATLYFETDEKVHLAITLHPITGLSKIEPIAPEGR
jgi:prepilin-type N-terminal cleavage/methylation domain-containing protein